MKNINPHLYLALVPSALVTRYRGIYIITQSHSLESFKLTVEIFHVPSGHLLIWQIKSHQLISHIWSKMFHLEFSILRATALRTYLSIFPSARAPSGRALASAGVPRKRGEGNKKGEEERGSASVSASNVEMSNGIFKYAEHLRL